MIIWDPTVDGSQRAAACWSSAGWTLHPAKCIGKGRGHGSQDADADPDAGAGAGAGAKHGNSATRQHGNTAAFPDAIRLKEWHGCEKQTFASGRGALVEQSCHVSLREPLAEWNAPRQAGKAGWGVSVVLAMFREKADQTCEILTMHVVDLCHS